MAHLNEVKRLQKIAGIIKENVNEAPESGNFIRLSINFPNPEDAELQSCMKKSVEGWKYQKIGAEEGTRTPTSFSESGF